ncbi:PfkB family carbohydrate kinase [Acanthopleuribacter pedis]|uniref:Adenylyltransferase/cytidyltransferase family protein n=1 Tax=Acanthopleuribacter pedis TaxID=442870 RepID=A0A8J7Q074_9BACT|nr:PfkB family carbohydrate kinase [Acanthopleuribacter pedis]MBO1317992.1 adenylyltransferase/cytidyltransferase family protein [Acanthopleuribacter pedis]
MKADKIVDLDQLGRLAAEARAAGRRVVLCHGTFDLIHIGHVRHLQRAGAEGDCLFVTITADRFVNKGPGRPIFNQQLRAENLAALEVVAHVAIVDDRTAIPAIEAVKPTVYAKGSDYQKPQDDLTGNIVKEQNAVIAGGGRTVYTDDIVFSSSQLLNEHFNVFSPDVKDYLRHFGERYQAKDIIEQVKALQGLKVLVVGDAIVDEYHYTQPMGQTGKGNILAVKHQEVEQFAGGSLAVANHVAGYCDQVSLLTLLGGRESFEPFIREKLKDNIKPTFFYREDAPTVRKSRFVDGASSKLFEVYYYEDSPLPPRLDEELCDWLCQHLPEYDCVIVPDFGNGFISRNMARTLSEHAPFLAVNTQINSGNRGFHTVNRYPRADFVSLNEPELRLAVHNRSDPIDVVARQVGERVKAHYVVTTLGREGLLLRDMHDTLSYQVPALSFKVVDRIGAGDAFLSLAGICIAGKLEPEVAGFIGSAAAAIDVQIVCNRESVEPADLFKYIVTLLK